MTNDPQQRTTRSGLAERRDRAQRMYYYILGIAAVAIVFVPLAIWRLNISAALQLYLALYGIAPLAMLPMLRARVTSLDRALQTLEFEEDLERYDVSPRESRAEKLLRLNDLHL